MGFGQVLLLLKF